MSASTLASSNIVLITGANQGLGFAIAKVLSAKPNYHVLVGSRNAQRGIDAAKQLQDEGLSVEPITIEYVVPPSLLHPLLSHLSPPKNRISSLRKVPSATHCVFDFSLPELFKLILKEY